MIIQFRACGRELCEAFGLCLYANFAHGIAHEFSIEAAFTVPWGGGRSIPQGFVDDHDFTALDAAHFAP